MLHSNSNISNYQHLRKWKILRLFACLTLKPVGQALPCCLGKQICCYRRSAFKVNPRTTAPSPQFHSGQQPSQRPDIRGIGTYEHGVVPLPVLFTLEALTMQVTRYSKQDQADHGRSRWSNLGNEFRHFLLHPNPRWFIQKVGTLLGCIAQSEG